MQAIFVHYSGGKQGQREKFERLPVRIGRSSSNDLILTGNDTRASSRHAEVYSDGSAFYIKDLGSTNGTFINGLRIRQAQLNYGDVIEFGLGGPKLSFEFDSSEKAHIDNIPATSRLKSPQDQEANRSNMAAREKEFGRDTVQVMLNRAVDLSSRRWKIALAISLVALVATITVALFQQFSPRRTPSEGTKAGAVPKVMTFSEIAARNYHAVVLIYNKFELYDKNGNLIQEQISNGSGFIANEAGEIITNRHVIEPWEFKSSLRLPSTISTEGVTGKIKQLGVFFADETLDPENLHKVIDFEISKEADVAVLRIKESEDLKPIQGINDNVQALSQGDEIAVLAFPLGLELNELTQDKTAKSSLTRGIISKIPENRRQIQLDVAAYEGSSGGPIFNNTGQVIGLLTSGPNDTLNFATPIRYATKMLKKR
jgi:pSer/pThr/pTyr-binding forkhead associated (FHA) protein